MSGVEVPIRVGEAKLSEMPSEEELGIPEDARAGRLKRPPTPPASEVFCAMNRFARRLRREMWTGESNPRFTEGNVDEITGNVKGILNDEGLEP